MKKRVFCMILTGILCLLAACGGRQKYTGQWMDLDSAEKIKDHAIHFLITQIYSDCFIADDTQGMGITAKLNGKLDSSWCVGDAVYVTYKNAWYDRANKKMEADIIRVETGNPNIWQSYNAKPVIYLYPEEETAVSVKLDYAGQLTCTYPAYNTGWNVMAQPDGTLTDSGGQTYNYLYWEGISQAPWDMTRGFCVKGEDTAAFLEEALEKQGLNRKEANEFIVYWLPLMQDNPYNIIAFQTEVYEDTAELEISPAPDTVIRVFMAWSASDEKVTLPAQELIAPERTGFTAVEWGGTMIK